MLVAILAVCSLETLLLWGHHRIGREACLTFSILGGKSVDNWGHDIKGKAFAECICSNRCCIPPEPLHLKGEVCKYSEKKLYHARKHKKCAGNLSQ